jgi:hypothetical protein
MLLPAVDYGEVGQRLQRSLSIQEILLRIRNEVSCVRTIFQRALYIERRFVN